jgi:hypothetical protein
MQKPFGLFHTSASAGPDLGRISIRPCDVDQRYIELLEGHPIPDVYCRKVSSVIVSDIEGEKEKKTNRQKMCPQLRFLTFNRHA